MLYSARTIKRFINGFDRVGAIAGLGLAMVSFSVAQTTPPGGLTDHQLVLRMRGLTATQNFAEMINRHAAEFSVDPALIEAVITVESDGNPNSVSRSGAMGLMQLMPGTCTDFNVANPYDPDENIRGGTALLAADSRRYHGDVEKTLAAYNAGPRHADDGSWVLISETRHYVPTVLAYYEALKDATDTLPPFQGAQPVPVLPPDPSQFTTPPVRYGDMMFSGLRSSINLPDPAGLSENGALDDAAGSILSDDLAGRISTKNLQAKAAKYVTASRWPAKGVKAFLLTTPTGADFTSEWDKQAPMQANVVGVAHGTSHGGHIWVVVVATRPQ